jgi:hypothetical protein
MAFGKHRKRREKKRKEAELEESLSAASDVSSIGQEYKDIQQVASGLSSDDQAQRETQREANKISAFEDVTTQLPGLDDSAKLAMQESANTAINNQIQNYSRQLASRSGQAGVRGGAAQSPQIDLASQGMQAQLQFQRDLVEKDSDVAMQRLAAYLSSVEGKSAEDILRDQQYIDFVTSSQDKKRESAYTKYFS